MAQIKIQRAEDIICAYLVGLGYDKSQDVHPLLAAYPHLEKGNIPAELDNILYHKALMIWRTKKYSKTKLTAMFKAVFIHQKLAETYGLSPLLPDFDDEVFRNLLQQSSYVCPAPAYKITAMPTQTITSVHLYKGRTA